MKLDIANKWVAALRSGAYKQGKDTLEKVTEGGVKYCCLGVLCSLATQEGIVQRKPSDENEDHFVYGTADEENELPQEVMDWAGTKSAQCILPNRNEKGHVYSLISLNDSGASFTQIASYIEQYAKDL